MSLCAGLENGRGHGDAQPGEIWVAVGTATRDRDTCVDGPEGTGGLEIGDDRDGGL